MTLAVIWAQSPPFPLAMVPTRPRFPDDPALANPAFNLLRLAALAARDEGELDDETLDLMGKQVQEGALGGVTLSALWPELEQGLMAHAPSRMFRALQTCGALAILLPEVAALFGVPQSADDPPEVDIGEHTLRVMDEAARQGAPLAVRFAALVMNLGKSDSPREHLPAHYRHMERGAPRIEVVCRRFGVPAECQDLARLALEEVERVHRAAEMRAGSMAALLERVGAFRDPDRFSQLMTLCSCDYRAYPGRATRTYPKAGLLTLALQACTNIDPAKFADPFDADLEDACSALLQARAQAIATALGSERWTPQDDLAP